MLNFLASKVSASGLGTDFAPQADVTGGTDSMAMFWVVAGILVIAGLGGFFAYKFFLE